MLERNVGARPRWRRWVTWSLAAGLAVVGLRASMWKDPPARPTIVVTVPAPILPPATVVVQPPAPPPLPPPAPPPAPVPTVAPPVVGTTCVANVDHLGVPMSAIPSHGGRILGAAVDSDGCTLTAWTKRTIYASWDGGQSFAQVDASADLVTATATAGRVVALRADGALGVLRPGGTIVWRAIAAAVAAPDNRVVGLFAKGAWIAETFSSVPLVAVSHDDGATWWYVAPPKDGGVDGIAASGEVLATRWTPTSEPDGMSPVEYASTYLRYDLQHPGWRTSDRDPPLTVAGWSYTLESDKFWGCGGSQKLVANRAGRAATLLGDLRTEVWPIELRTNRHLGFATLSNHLYRLAGPRLVDLGELPDVALIGVDGASTAIATSLGQLLRWSPRGGWRVLLDMPGDDG